MKKITTIIFSAVMLLASITMFPVSATTVKTLVDTQKFCDDVMQYLNWSEGSEKLTPETIRSKSEFEFYKETEEIVVFRIVGQGDMMAYDIIGDYKFNANSWFGKEDTNRCGNFVYTNGKLYELRTAVEKGLVDIVEMAAIIPNTEFIGDGEAPVYKPSTVKKNSNPIKVTVNNKTIKYNKVKKTKQTVAPITVKKAAGKVSYKKISGSKKLTLKTNGKIVVKKGTKKGTYTAKIKVTAKGNANYKSGSKTVDVKIIVK